MKHNNCRILLAIGSFLVVACIITYLFIGVVMKEPKDTANSEGAVNEVTIKEDASEEANAEQAESTRLESTTQQDQEEQQDHEEHQAQQDHEDASAQQQDEIEEYLSQMTLEEKVAQLFIITPEALTGYSTVTAAGEVTKEALAQYPVGGLIYFTPNLTQEEQVKTMLEKTQEYAMELNGLPLFLSVDEEGGTVARIANNAAFDVTKVGDMATIGEKKDYDLAYQAGVTIGSYLKKLGFNLDYAPDADVYSNPANEIVKRRSFGSDPELVSAMDLLVLKGLQEQGIYGVYKHFPGHGSTVGDTHEGYAYTEETLDEMMADEIIPFQDAIGQQLEFIMVGHISAPNIIADETPSSLSSIMITDILRGRLGFDGIVMTDALNMKAVQGQYSSAEAAILTIQAGTDILLMPENFKEAYDGVLEAVKSGKLSEERIDESVKRILKVKFVMRDK